MKEGVAEWAAEICAAASVCPACLLEFSFCTEAIINFLCPLLILDFGKSSGSSNLIASRELKPSSNNLSMASSSILFLAAQAFAASEHQIQTEVIKQRGN